MDRRLRAASRRQHGLLTRPQLLEVLSLQQARTALHDLEVVVPGIYRVGGMPRSWRQTLLAAVLAAGPGAVASHQAAAALWGLASFGAGPIVVEVPHGGSRRSALAVVHQTRSLEPIDVTTIDHIPVTRVPRTLFDLAGQLTPTRLEDALDDALCRRLTTFGRVQRRNDALRARGRPNLDDVLRAWTPGAIPDSVAEARLIRRLVANGLPEPERQVQIGDIRVDLLYRPWKLVIEYESSAGTPAAGATSAPRSGATTSRP